MESWMDAETGSDWPDGCKLHFTDIIVFLYQNEEEGGYK